jgi:hypothetical protein
VTINESVLIEYAREHNLEFARDPYHASEGFEFRRYDKAIESIGFLFGRNSVEVYRWRSDRALDLIHRRLWFIESVLKPFVGKKRDSYQVIEQFPLERFSETEALAILRRYFDSTS